MSEEEEIAKLKVRLARLEALAKESEPKSPAEVQPAAEAGAPSGSTCSSRRGQRRGAAQCADSGSGDLRRLDMETGKDAVVSTRSGEGNLGSLVSPGSADRRLTCGHG
jgi:hypothetical protein